MRMVRAAPGIEFRFIDPDDSTVRESLPGNSYEPAVASLLLKCVRPGDVIIDIGALYGYFSCFCASISADVQVYAFDPCRKYCDVIERNARINQLANIHAVSLALTDVNSEWQFREKTLIAGTREAGNVSHEMTADVREGPEREQFNPAVGVAGAVARVSAVRWLIATVKHAVSHLFSPPRQMAVSSVRYDDWAKANAVKARIAKIDVHGAEIVVLRGMTHALQQDLEHVIVEVHKPDMLIEGDYRELVSLLVDSGFKLHELVDFRSDTKWRLVPMSGRCLEDFVDFHTWSFRNKLEMRMIYATKAELQLP